MSGGVLVVIDSALTDSVVYGDTSFGSWTTKNGPKWFNNSSASSGTAPGSINITFSGTAIALYGRSPPLGESRDMTVTIDEQEPFEATFLAEHAGRYCQLWQSQILADGTHTIQLQNLRQMVFDFAAVTVNKSFLKTGQQIIVDDDDVSMKYSGNWKRHSLSTSNLEKPKSQPFHNVTHRSKTVGDSVSFTFTGSTIAVYGVMPVNKPGFVDARYTLDSNAKTVRHQQPSQGHKEHRNFLLYSSSTLSPGSHTLSIEIQDAPTFAYSLDYVVYTFSPELVPQSTKDPIRPTTSQKSSSSSVAPPSSTLSSRATSIISSSSSSSSSSFSSSSSNATTTVAPSTPLPLPPVLQSTLSSESQSITSPVVSPTQAAELSSETNRHTGEIIGISVGGVAILAALITAMLFWRRRRRRHFLPIQTVEYSFKPAKPLATASGSRSSIRVQPFTLTEPAPGSRAASETTDQKYGSFPIFDISPNAILEQLHRRSWSRTGSKLRDSLGDAETQCTMATSPGSIVGDGKPPSYRA